MNGSAALARFRELRRVRSRREADNFDRFYRIYVTTLGALIAFYLSLGLVDATTVDAASLRWVQERGPLWISLVAALAIAAGVRSGANGGPLTIDLVELQHVLMSPIERTTVLARPTVRLLLAAVGLGATVGAACGELASRQLPGNQLQWVAVGLLTGTTVGASSVGAAVVASGLVRDRRMVALMALGLPMWAIVDLATGVPTSPTSGFGELAVWPLNRSMSAATALVISLLLVGWGRALMGRASVELLHHRSALVRQIRFAMAQQDIRSLLLLRRQLGFETPRQRPWLVIPPGSRFENRFPVVVRDARSYLRWPVGRLLRVAALSVAAGLALGAVWHGTTALIAVVGVALYAAAIEVIEPLGQELDHPGIVELIPVTPGAVNVGHAVSAVAAMSIVWFVAGAVAAVVSLEWHLAIAVGIAVLPASAAAVAAAALSIKRFHSPMLPPSPEVEGPRLVIRLLWPPALTLAGALPVLVARNATINGTAIGPPTVNASAAVGLVAVVALAWIRLRDDIADAAAAAQGERS